MIVRIKAVEHLHWKVSAGLQLWADEMDLRW